jgi:hypothetical protein
MATTGIDWPAGLPDCAGTYSEKAEPVTVRTNVEEGPAKVRRRFTQRVVRAQVGMQMHINQYDILDDFFYIQLNGGVGRFNFKHPWTGVASVWRMIESPDFSDMGPMAVQVTMVWELMP